MWRRKRRFMYGGKKTLFFRGGCRRIIVENFVLVQVLACVRSCATKDANNEDYVCKPNIPAGINCPPPSKTISPITWLIRTISTLERYKN